MLLTPATNDIAQRIGEERLGVGVPESQYMIPGKTYVGRLPGRLQKGFVRKRPYDSRTTARVEDVRAIQLTGPDAIYQPERRTRMPRWLTSMFGSDYGYYDDRYRQRRVIYDNPRYGLPPHRPVASTRQVCSGCGKFRSPSWSARHPVRYGEVPLSSLCRKCTRKSTSSAESPYYPRRRRRRHHHHGHSRNCDSTGDSPSHYDGMYPCHPHGRYRSESLDYVRPRSLRRSGSGERMNVVIQNNGSCPPSRVRTMSSSDDAVRVTHRVAVDRPARRGILRSASSDFAFSDGFVEEVMPRRRPLSNARRRSRSSVRFVDELENPRYHRRPRRLSHRSSVEAVIESRPRSYSRRRRHIYYDGAAESQKDSTYADEDVAEEEAQSCRGGGQVKGIAAPSAQPTTLESRRIKNRSLNNSLTLGPSGQDQVSANSFTSASNEFFTQYGDARLEQQHFDLKGHSDNQILSSSGASSRGITTGRERAVSAEPGYEVDSQNPSPPSVTYANPSPRPTRIPPPLSVRTISPPSDYVPQYQRRCYSEPLSPACSNGGVTNVNPRQTSFEGVGHSNQLPTPPYSYRHINKSNLSLIPLDSERNEIEVSAAMIDSPNHPDHLAYLLSQARFSENPRSQEYGDLQGIDDERLSSMGSVVNEYDAGNARYHNSSRPYSLVSYLDEGYQRNPPALVPRNPMRDMFDSDELEKKYNETQADSLAEEMAHMQAMKKRKRDAGVA